MPWTNWTVRADLPTPPLPNTTILYSRILRSFVALYLAILWSGLVCGSPSNPPRFDSLPLMLPRPANKQQNQFQFLQNETFFLNLNCFKKNTIFRFIFSYEWKHVQPRTDNSKSISRNLFLALNGAVQNIWIFGSLPGLRNCCPTFGRTVLWLPSVHPISTRKFNCVQDDCATEQLNIHVTFEKVTIYHKTCPFIQTSVIN